MLLTKEAGWATLWGGGGQPTEQVAPLAGALRGHCRGLVTPPAGPAPPRPQPSFPL